VLDPEIQQLVDRMEAEAPPPGREVPLDEARAAHDRGGVLFGGPGEEVAGVRDITVPGPRGSIPVRVFRPDGEGPLPVVAYAHGGGWVLGSVDGFEPVCRALANASGAVVASIGYRLAPEHPFPAGLEDVLATVRWLAVNARELDGDPDRLAIAGDSAGGNLATVASRRLRDDRGPALRLQALVYPVCNSALDTRSYRECSDGFGLTAQDMEHFWQLYLAGADGSDPDASPLRADDLSGLPPTFVLTVRNDVLRDEGDAYARALEAAGVPVTLRRYDSAVHGFFRWLAKARISRRAVADVGAALREALG
jgi:acetyl esterase